ncbi:MAG: hypothetical protein HY899_00555 [Deltaproteobacteria bacterium]|nr:hypothetical protein [Deltaproteobacteria bacterium]
MQQAERQTNRSNASGQSDTLAILGMFAFGLLSAAMVLVVVARVLMNLPPLLGAAIAFSLIVFLIACGAALALRKETGPSAGQPPTLLFRKPPGAMR